MAVLANSPLSPTDKGGEVGTEARMTSLSWTVVASSPASSRPNTAASTSRRFGSAIVSLPASNPPLNAMSSIRQNFRSLAPFISVWMSEPSRPVLARSLNFVSEVKKHVWSPLDAPRPKSATMIVSSLAVPATESRIA